MKIRVIKEYNAPTYRVQYQREDNAPWETYKAGKGLTGQEARNFCHAKYHQYKQSAYYLNPTAVFILDVERDY